MSAVEEVIVKTIGKLTIEFGWDFQVQLKAREILYSSLAGYEVKTLERSLVASDLYEKIDLYLKFKKFENYSPETLNSKGYTLRKFASKVKVPSGAVNKQDILFYLMCECEGKKPGTYNNYLGTIKAFFQWLVDNDMILKNPANQIPEKKVDKDLRGYLKVQELEEVRLSCKDERQRALVEVLFATGCRLGEVVGMNKNDINYLDGSIKVKGKGSKERVVMINEKAMLYLQKYLEVRNDDCEALFVTVRHPIHRLGRRSIQTLMNDVGVKADIQSRVHPHLIRHTFATLGHQAGADLVTLQHLMGHTSPATTQIYAKQNLENIKYVYRHTLNH